MTDSTLQPSTPPSDVDLQIEIHATLCGVYSVMAKLGLAHIFGETMTDREVTDEEIHQAFWVEFNNMLSK